MRFPNNELKKALNSVPFYALCHKLTGRFLPRPPSGKKGGTWVEPVHPTEAVPRLFHTISSAKGYLTVWLQGPQTWNEKQDFNGDYYSECKVDPAKAKEPRIRDEWEVVEIFWGVKDAN